MSNYPRPDIGPRGPLANNPGNPDAPGYNDVNNPDSVATPAAAPWASWSDSGWSNSHRTNPNTLSPSGAQPGFTVAPPARDLIGGSGQPGPGTGPGGDRGGNQGGGFGGNGGNGGGTSPPTTHELGSGRDVTGSSGFGGNSTGQTGGGSATNSKGDSKGQSNTNTSTKSDTAAGTGSNTKSDSTGNSNTNNNSTGNPGSGPASPSRKSPVLLDLAGQGIKITELSRSQRFVDSEGDGLFHRTAWAAADNVVLFFDPDGRNATPSNRQYIFTEWDPTAASDIEALKAVFDKMAPQPPSSLISPHRLAA